MPNGSNTMKWRPKICSEPVITLTSDFGSQDPFVGMMKAVILSITTKARIVDVTHGVSSHDVMEAALVIKASYSYFPKGSIHVVVVDPGVGSSRRPLLVVTESGYFLAPDNGVLSEIYSREERFVCLNLTTSRFFHQPLSQTFHGRDIFSPAAAWLSRGIHPSCFGEVASSPVRLCLPRVRKLGKRKFTGNILKVDKFGNVVTNIPAEKFQSVFGATNFQLRIGSQWVTRVYSSYTQAQDQTPFAIWGSFGLLEISCNQASAAKKLNVVPYDEVEIKINSERNISQL